MGFCFDSTPLFRLILNSYLVCFLITGITCEVSTLKKNFFYTYFLLLNILFFALFFSPKNTLKKIFFALKPFIYGPLAKHDFNHVDRKVYYTIFVSLNNNKTYIHI